MKKIKINNSIRVVTLLLLVISLLLQSCKKNELDTIPPGEISVKSIEPTHGGAIIHYDLPGDDDLLYVKAEYINSQGNTVFKASSRFANAIEVDGFNDTLAHPIRLYTLDRSNNASEGISVEVSPAISFIYVVQETIQIQPDLGGVLVNWENPAEKTVFVYLFYSDGQEERSRILSSNKSTDAFIVRGLDSVDYEFSTLVEDFNGNKTEKLFLQTVKPLFEEKINKSTWTLVQNLSIDGNAWEGVTENFWDDVVDTHQNPDDNSYFIINRDNNGGILNYPLDIVIDLNKSIILNRLTVWQRAYWYVAGNNWISEIPYYYQNENMRSFDLWASNDMQEWLLLGEFDIGDPRDNDGNIPPDKIKEAIDGHEFELDDTSEPFRYLKFAITSSYGSETNVYGSEITLFGLDNVQ